MLLNAIKDNLKLTLPILLTRLLGITSNLIAMILIAKLGSIALSASALIMGVFSFCVLLVMAFSFSVCAIVAEACGSKKDSSVGAIIGASMVLNTLLALPFMVFFYHIALVLSWLHQPPPVFALVGQYFRGMLLGYLPMIWASILEQFFIGIGKPRYIVYLSIIGLFIMPILSNVLIFGKYGFPAFGMFGAGLAVSLTSLVSLIFLIILIGIKKWHIKYSLFSSVNHFDYSIFKNLCRLGWPTALQYGGEFLAYILITIMMGWLGVVALAAQQVILQFTSVVVMIPTSISQATAVLVGKAYGSKEALLVRHQVNISILVVTFFMILIAAAYILIPDALSRIYVDANNSQSTSILALTKILLSITAFSQCFDGIRNVLAGAYRGLQETKTPMLIGTISLWLISIPLSYILGFYLHDGAVGVRWGFAIGVMVGTVVLAISWYRDQIPVSSPILINSNS